MTNFVGWLARLETGDCACPQARYLSIWYLAVSSIPRLKAGQCAS